MDPRTAGPIVPPRQLAAMPLHAITEVYGEAGLRGRLTLELEHLLAADRDVVEAAATWAGVLHDRQRRTREPYVNHVLRVAIRIACYYRITDPEVLAAALLHDTVEDQPWRMTDRTPDGGPAPRQDALTVLSGRFGPRVAGLVAAVTNPERTVGVDRHTQYLDHLRTSLTADPWARVIKLSDFTDNGVGIIHTVGPKLHSSARKYTPAVPLLHELLDRPDTPLEPAVKDLIRRQLHLAESRFAAILAA